MLEAAEELRAHGQPEAAASILDRAIEWYQRLPSEEAGTPNSRFEQARALYLAGRLDAAEALFRQLVIDDPFNLPEYDGSLGAIAARRGDRATAEAIASRLEQQRLAADPPPKYPLFAQARIAAQLGDAERAVRLLRQALGGQGLDLHMVPDFEPLATDPGFREFIRPKG
jgi:predicted Zn-dependent protease